MKSNNNIIKKWITITLLVGIIGYVVIKNQIDRKNILKNPYQTVATITGIEGCFKNGRCITYKYVYEGKSYQSFSSTSWGFSNWCKNRKNCIGFQFEITINKKNPEKVIADWKDIFEHKNFLNYP